MDFKTAKKVLETSNLTTFTEEGLYSVGWYLAVTAGREDATLDGLFTADDLEAIATWMRNPKAVVEA